MALPPLPLPDLNSLPYTFQDWLRKLSQVFSGLAGAVPWISVNKAGANLTDLPTRHHNDLQTIQGGTAAQYYHLTSSEYTGTGTGVFVRATSPTLTTPIIGVATATTINKVTVTQPATGSTLTIDNGFTLHASANATVSGTNTGDQTITLTGDVTGSGTGSFAATLASVITAGGPTGSTSVVPVITYDAKGRLTTVTTATVTPAAIGAVPTTTTVNGHALSSNVTVTASDVGLGSVTNDAQTKAAIVPNTAPTSGQILVGNAGGTAYAPVTVTGSGATIALDNLGVIHITAIPNGSLSNSSMTIAGHSVALGGTQTLAASDLTDGTSGTGSIALVTTGTFSPVLAGDGTAGTPTYGTNGQKGYYTRIGNLVMFQIWIQTTAWTGSTGNLIITGMPFAGNSATNQISVFPLSSKGITFPAGTTQIQALLYNGLSQLYFSGCGSAANEGFVASSSWSASSYIQVSGCYSL